MQALVAKMQLNDFFLYNTINGENYFLVFMK